MHFASIPVKYPQRLTAKVSAAALAAVLLVGPVSAQPLAQAGGVGASAPENLRCAGKSGPRDGFHFEAQWQLQASFAEGSFGFRPQAVTLDHDCNVYVTDTVANRIVKYAPDGKETSFPLAARPADQGGPTGVAVDAGGNIYVADHVTHGVHKLSRTGQELAFIGNKCANDDSCVVDEPGAIVSPAAVAVDGAGTIFVLDDAAERVQRFRPDGTPLKPWGKQGEGPGEMEVPSAIALDGQGNVYIADTGNDRIQKYSAEGAFLSQWGSLGDSDSPIQFKQTKGIAVDLAGNMYVSDLYNWRVVKLSPDGQLQDQWVVTEVGEFFNHGQLSVDGQGNLYVADGGNNRVERRIVVEVANPPDGANQPATD